MDPINIIVAVNIIALFGANLQGAKKGLRTSVAQYRERPKTWLQNAPPSLATLALVLLAVSLFQVGTLPYTAPQQPLRLAGLLVYLTASWLQVWCLRTLGDNYSQDIVILKNHSLVTRGPYRFIRHPQYFLQFIADASAAAAVLSWLVMPVAVIELPLLVMRALAEDRLLLKHFGDAFREYSRKSGFFLPMIG